MRGIYKVCLGLAVMFCSAWGQEGEKKELTPAEWRAAASKAAEEVKVSIEKDPRFSFEANAKRALGEIRSLLYGSNLIYKADVLRDYVSEADLKSYESFVGQKPEKTCWDIEREERRKIENELLKSEAETVKKRAEIKKMVEEKHQLAKIGDKVEFKNARGAEIKGELRARTDSTVQVGYKRVQRVDLPLESRALFWSWDREKFIKEEYERLMKKARVVVDNAFDEKNQATIQMKYLEAGYLPDFFQKGNNYFSMKPQYWLTREQLLTRYIRKNNKQLENEFMNRMRAKGYVYEVYDKGDKEWIPKGVYDGRKKDDRQY